MPAMRTSGSLSSRFDALSIVDSHQPQASSSKRLASRSSEFSASAAAEPPKKKKKASNAFILYRSYVLANNLLPADITHQNEASRAAGQMWAKVSPETRARFYAMAEERKREAEREEREAEAKALIATIPPSPALSFGTSTSSPYSSFPPTPCSPFGPPFDPCSVPSAPKMYTPELPSSPCLTLSPFWELAPVFEPVTFAEPKHDEPQLSTLSDEWSSPDFASSLSLGSERGDDAAWSIGNALGLYFSPPSFLSETNKSSFDAHSAS